MRQGHRLLRVGAVLLFFSALEGFAIPHLAAPRMGLSVHTLSAFEGVLMMTLGLVWPRLALGRATSRLAFWLLVYSSLAILAAYVMGALWDAGNEMMPLAAGTAHGTALQE